MMKVLLLIFSLIYATSAADCTSKSSDADSLDKLDEILLKRCTNNAQGDDAYSKLLVSIKEFPNCVKYAFDSEPPNGENFCSYLNENELYSCVADLTKAALPCLDESEAYLPDFILNAFNSSYDELCGTIDTDKVNFLFDTLEGYPECLRKAADKMYSDGICLSELYMKKNFNQVTINLNKHDVCSDLETLKNCVGPLLQQECKMDFIISINLIFNPLLKQCQE